MHPPVKQPNRTQNFPLTDIPTENPADGAHLMSANPRVSSTFTRGADYLRLI